MIPLFAMSAVALFISLRKSREPWKCVVDTVFVASYKEFNLNLLMNQSESPL